MSSIYLELPSLTREQEVIQFVDEFDKYNSNINGTGGFSTNSNYADWVKRVLQEHDGFVSREDRVPASTYLAIREADSKVVGMVNIRHYLSDILIKHGWGHIGYSVRPLERRKGYATEILRLALEKCRELNIEKVHVGCNKDNIGSKKTIENNNGILFRELIDDVNEALEYIISL